MLILLNFYISSAFKIRLYHRDVYLGLPETEGIVPTMVNYEIAQKFETEEVGDYSDASFILVKDTANYVLGVAGDRNMQLLYWNKHGGANQRWLIGRGRLNSRKLFNQERCLEYLPDEDELRMEYCSENENQMFNFIEDEDEDHGLHTQANVSLRQDVQGNFVYGFDDVVSRVCPSLMPTNFSI